MLEKGQYLSPKQSLIPKPSQMPKGVLMQFDMGHSQARAPLNSRENRQPTSKPRMHAISTSSGESGMVAIFH